MYSFHKTSISIKLFIFLNGRWLKQITKVVALKMYLYEIEKFYRSYVN